MKSFVKIGLVKSGWIASAKFGRDGNVFYTPARCAYAEEY
jgi:hypothetical protein